MARMPPLGLRRGTVRLVESDRRWAELFRAEAERLAEAIARAGLAPLAFEHVGSTAVPRLAAKPILDVMAGSRPDADWGAYAAVFVDAGYEARGPQGVVGRELFVLGPESSRTHHLNLVVEGGPVWREALAFRDRLRADPAVAAAYESLKRDLAARHASDRGAYTAGKAAFVAATLREGPDRAG